MFIVNSIVSPQIFSKKYVDDKYKFCECPRSLLTNADTLQFIILFSSLCLIQNCK